MLLYDYEAKARQRMRSGKWSEGGCPYNSGGQFGGRSILCPSRSSENSSSTGMPGYGEPPRVKISHSRIPKDHLEAEIGLSRAHRPSSLRLW